MSGQWAIEPPQEELRAFSTAIQNKYSCFHSAEEAHQYTLEVWQALAKKKLLQVPTQTVESPKQLCMGLTRAVLSSFLSSRFLKGVFTSVVNKAKLPRVCFTSIQELETALVGGETGLLVTPSDLYVHASDVAGKLCKGSTESLLPPLNCIDFSGNLQEQRPYTGLLIGKLGCCSRGGQLLFEDGEQSIPCHLLNGSCHMLSEFVMLHTYCIRRDAGNVPCLEIQKYFSLSLTGKGNRQLASVALLQVVCILYLHHEYLCLCVCEMSYRQT